jgi:hypothetical protein
MGCRNRPWARHGQDGSEGSKQLCHHTSMVVR